MGKIIRQDDHHITAAVLAVLIKVKCSIITTLNRAWYWTGIEAAEIVRINDFGNVLFRSVHNDYWRICPEELSFKRVAADYHALEQLLRGADFNLDWQMNELAADATAALGTPADGEVYYLIVPAVLGGTYAVINIGKLPLLDLLALSADLAYQIKNLPDGQPAKLVIRRNLIP